MADKTEAPTEQRLREARDNGQVVKSQEIKLTAQILAIITYFYVFGYSDYNKCCDLVQISINSLNEPFDISLKLMSANFFYFVLYISFSIGILVSLFCIISLLSQVGFLFSFSVLSIKLDKFNPINNLMNLFSIKNLVEFCKSVIKISLVSLVFFYLLKTYIISFQYLPILGIKAAIPITAEVIDWLLKSLLACYFIFSLGDYSFQRFMIMKELMMTKEEIKQEYKNNEGDPEVKARRNELHMEIQSGSLSSKVKKSNVIVKNPTHYAVGIMYQRGVTSLPIVTVKGAGEFAKKILEYAKEYNIPVIEQVSLARSLYSKSNIDSAIPKEYLEHVADILRIILQTADS